MCFYTDRNVELLQEQTNKTNKARNGGNELNVRPVDLTERLHGFSGSIPLTPFKPLDILVVLRPFDLVTAVLFIAILHGNALHPSFPH